MPEDFIVKEIIDLEKLKEKKLKKLNKEGKNKLDECYFFKLTKKNYSQIRAIEKISKIFHISKKRIFFAGTKDKLALTEQLICINHLNKNFEKNLDFFNNNIKDLKLEYISKENFRLNLGDNEGNLFIITLRDLKDEEIKKIKKNIETISKDGIFNYFESQRFGYANNSHIIGKYLIKKEIDKAIYEILTSTPIENPQDEITNYTDFIKKNYEKIINQNKNILKKIFEIIPNQRKEDLKIIEHLYKYKNDFYGAFRTIPKKLRTLYINAYQSYIFNETLNFIKKNYENINNIEKIEEIELINSEFKCENEDITNFILNKIKEDNINLEDLKLNSMPEIKIKNIKRKIKIYPKEIKIINIEKDEFFENKNKIIIEFKLGSGEYATNVIQNLL
jgi:tRNA pseudouridine13 synthase